MTPSSLPPPDAPRRHVVIVGAGFGGLYAARALGRAPVKITVIDRSNHHVFQPLLYQVATAALSPGDIARPHRSILRRQGNSRVLLAEARSVDVEARRVTLDEGEVPYDYLILAAGVTHSYFGNDGWAPLAPGLKTVEDALEIRRRILVAFEEAEASADPARRRALLTFVIVGGGPTGVELAGSLAELTRKALVEDFRNIDPAKTRILVVEALDRILPTFDPKSSARAQEELARLGVEVLTDTRVEDILGDGVVIDGKHLPASTVLWAAGQQAAPIAKSLRAPLDKAGRVEVDAGLTIGGHPEVFVIGDLAALRQDGEMVPGVAQAAMQQARHVAESIVSDLKGLPRRPFRYRDKGMLAVVGRNRAVADLPRLRLTGFVAWVAWVAVHIWFLIGFRNRLVVMLQWAWAYVTWERGARLITSIRRGESSPD